MDELLPDLARADLTAAGRDLVKNGRPVRLDDPGQVARLEKGPSAAETIRLFGPDGRLSALARLKESSFDLVVTFNGTSFDLPFIRRAFPNISLPAVHIDLRFVMRRLGYRGGLKKIEKEINTVKDKIASLEADAAAIAGQRERLEAHDVRLLL